jgi:hypothetical protein
MVCLSAIVKPRQRSRPSRGCRARGKGGGQWFLGMQTATLDLLSPEALQYEKFYLLKLRCKSHQNIWKWYLPISQAVCSCNFLVKKRQLKKCRLKEFSESLLEKYSFFSKGKICLTYRVSQEECARLREGLPYVKVHRYNPKHLCPKLNGYEDNGQRKVWYSGGSTQYTCQLTALSMLRRRVWCHITAIQLVLFRVFLCSLKGRW